MTAATAHLITDIEALANEARNKARGILDDLAHHDDTDVIAAAAYMADRGETTEERDNAAAVLALLENVP